MNSSIFKQVIAGQFRLALIFTVVFIGLVGCQKSMESAPQDSQSGTILQGTSTGNPGGGKIVTFSQVYNEVFSSSCVSCHGGHEAESGIRYDNYQAAIKFGDLDTLAAAYRHYHEPNRECDKISNSKMDLVRTWIETGAQP